MLTTILKLLAGLVTLIQSLVNEYDKQKDIEQGRLEEQSKQQAQKASDEAIAAKVDLSPERHGLRPCHALGLFD